MLYKSFTALVAALVLCVILLSIGNYSNAGSYIGQGASVPTNLTQAQLYSVFTMSKTYWDTGHPIVIVMYPQDSVVFRDFVMRELGMTTISYERIIQSRLLLGNTARPPRYANTDYEMIGIVIREAGAVAYFDGALRLFDPYKCDSTLVQSTEVREVMRYCFHVIEINK